MPRAAAGPRGRRAPDLPPALLAVEERMLTLAGETCPPELGPVLGEGNPEAALALVGEAPGDREVAEGYPFAGPAGRLLDTLLAEAGLRRADLWITNVVKCRPVREEKGRLANRAPLAGEIKAWLPLLLDELAIVNPRLVLCLGGTAARALLGRDFKLTEQRGQWVDGPLGTRAMATFHPAYVLHLETHDPSGSRAARATLLLDLKEAAARLHAYEPGGAS
jgi:uracil-DNA glycosylase family 4